MLLLWCSCCCWGIPSPLSYSSTKPPPWCTSFFQAAVLFLLIVPVLTMRQFAEERKSGTLELLLTAPVREIDIVLAKFLACMAVNTLMLALSLIYALVLHAYGQPDWGPIYSGYVGLVLFTAALLP